MNGVIDYFLESLPPYSVETVATYSCDEGFILLGSERRTCEYRNGSTGIWSDVEPTCDGIMF